MRPVTLIDVEPLNGGGCKEDGTLLIINPALAGQSPALKDTVPDISQLPVGHELAPVHYQVRAEEVGLYLHAVEESNPLFGEGGITPPTTLAACALKGILREIDLPPGAVHAAQDLAFAGAVAPGAALVFQARVAQNAVRRGWRYLAIDFSATDQEGRQVLQGRSTVLIPEDQGGRGGDEAR